MSHIPQKGQLPALFLERFKSIVERENDPSFIEGFYRERNCSIRVNTLKTTVKEAMDYFSQIPISFEKTEWDPRSFILKNIPHEDVSRLEWVSQGKLYIQSLSSMLPVLVLDPRPGERVMDMCAAPGSKTTQIAALMKNQGEIVAIDSVRPRFYRLKAVLALTGAEIVRAKCLDAARFRSHELFDRILVDVPCSSESRFKASDPKTFGYWSPRKIKEMAHKQKGILLNACRFLKPGGTLVYSTCTFAPEENEAVIDWVLRKLPDQMKLLPVELPGVSRYSSLPQWESRRYDPIVQHCFRVRPSEMMEGFFIAKLTRG